jgi:hypothetical protein
LPNTSGVFETIGASEATGDDAQGEGKTSVDDDESTTGTVDPTKGDENTTPVDSEDGTSSADTSTSAAATAEGGTSTDGEVEGGPTSTTEPETLACVDEDLGDEVGDAVAAGNSGDGDDVAISCANGGGEDVVFSWTAPSAGSWTFDLSGSSYDTALAIIEPACDGRELACNDDAIGLTSMLTMDLGAGEEVLVVVDGYDGAVGSYVLDVNPAADLSCADEDLADGSGATGSTVGESDSFAIGCAGGGGADYIFAWIAPTSGTWNFSLAGSSYDTALSIWSPDCDGGEIACNDDSDVDLTSVLDLDLEAGETVIVVVDGYMGATGDFTLVIQ